MDIKSDKTFSWKGAAEEKLVEMVEPMRYLWDSYDPLHARPDIVRAGWADIGRVLGCSGHEASHQFVLLKRRYRRCIITDQETKNGVLRRPFFLKQKMGFLQAIFARKKKRDTSDDVERVLNVLFDEETSASTTSISNHFNKNLLKEENDQLKDSITIIPSKVTCSTTVPPPLAKIFGSLGEASSNSAAPKRAECKTPTVNPSGTPYIAKNDPCKDTSSILLKKVRRNAKAINMATHSVLECANRIANRYSDKAEGNICADPLVEGFITFITSAMTRLSKEQQEDFMQRATALYWEIKNN